MATRRTYPLIVLASLLLIAGCRTQKVYPLTGLLSAPNPSYRLLFLAVSAQFETHSAAEKDQLPKMNYVWHKAANGRLKEALLDAMPTDRIVCIITYAGGSRQFLPVHLPLAPHLPHFPAQEALHAPVESATLQPLEILLRVNLTDSTRTVRLVGRQKRGYKSLLSLNVL